MVLKSSKNGLFCSGEFSVAVYKVGLCIRWDRLLSLTLIGANKLWPVHAVKTLNFSALSIKYTIFNNIDLI